MMVGTSRPSFYAGCLVRNAVYGQSKSFQHRYGKNATTKRAGDDQIFNVHLYCAGMSKFKYLLYQALISNAIFTVA